MAEETKKFAERVRQALDALVEALEDLLSPQPAPVPVRVRRPPVRAKLRR